MLDVGVEDVRRSLIRGGVAAAIALLPAVAMATSGADTEGYGDVGSGGGQGTAGGDVGSGSAEGGAESGSGSGSGSGSESDSSGSSSDHSETAGCNLAGPTGGGPLALAMLVLLVTRRAARG